MLVVRLKFPGGRYHANPWGRNVNEGVAEWPPSPFRLVRALIDVCRRRRPDWDDERLTAVISALERPIGFRLPPISISHTRSFLSSNKKDPTAKQKIFDAFVIVDRSKDVLAVFDAEVAECVVKDLDDLLRELNYLGRSESWVDAGLVAEVTPPPMNCVLKNSNGDRQDSQVVRVACLRPRERYSDLTLKPVTGKGKNARTLPWLEAVSTSTRDLLKQGWSSPPTLEMVDFSCRRNLVSPHVRNRCRILESSSFKIAKFALQSAVLPRVTETVPFAERIRSHLMGIHRKVSGGDPGAVSPLFSGKTPEGRPDEGHRHVYILPLDENGDGRIDHLLIKSSLAFEVSEIETLDRLRGIWQPDGRPGVMIVLKSLVAEHSGATGRRWISVTPFVTARHHRKGRGDYFEWLANEVRIECGFHGLPEPVSIEWIDHTRGGGHQLRWMEFVRSRKGRTPFRGHGCVLTFQDDVSGPFAIGALSHFGLGLFQPVGDNP